MRERKIVIVSESERDESQCRYLSNSSQKNDDCYFSFVDGIGKKVILLKSFLQSCHPRPSKKYKILPKRWLILFLQCHWR